MKKVAIVLPLYKDTMTEEEEKSLRQLLKVLGNRDLYVMVPESFPEMTFHTYPSLKKFTIVKFPDVYFQSTQSYSFLLETPDFWKTWSDYEYLMIYQLDCWIFRDHLDHFIEMGYDYYGAPFLVYRYKNIIYNELVGNGGFSLRKISEMIRITEKYGPEMVNFDDLHTPGVGLGCTPEDMYYSLFHKDELNICPPEIAMTFSVEYYPEVYLERLNGDVPMGCHKVWDYKETWEPYLIN